jgi:uncharacterized protein
MKILVKVKAGAKEDKLVAPKLMQESLWKNDEEREEWYTVSVKAPAIQGKANDAVIKLLTKEFNVSQSQVRLLRGATSKRKVFEILD